MRATLGPTVFAIDTSGERCCLVLSRGTKVQTQLGQAGHNHLEQVMPMIEQLFGATGLRPEQCDAFAFGSGPGSFTGLRVACTIVQGLAWASSKPVIAVGHLQILARAAAKSDECAAGCRRRILALADARMQQAYWAVYDRLDNVWSEAAPPSLCPASALAQLISVWQPDCCAGNAAWIGQYLGGDGPPVRDVAVEGGVIAQLVQEKFVRGEFMQPEQALPGYVRERVALTVSERRSASFGERR